MAKYLMVVQSRALPGSDDAYNDWYDTTHLEDILSLPGVESGRRFDFAAAMMGEPGLPYLAIYEIETDDVTSIIDELGRRSAAGTMRQTDTIDAQASVLWFYKERSPV